MSRRISRVVTVTGVPPIQSRSALRSIEISDLDDVGRVLRRFLLMSARTRRTTSRRLKGRTTRSSAPASKASTRAASLRH
ncbi:MAG: hypothetical protein U0270_35130 [Labilithrix sp.]